MSEELLINISPTENRVAILDNGVLTEIYIERQNKLGSVGNIYLGTVVRVLPGMQAAFVEIGQSRTAFLHVNDMQPVKIAPTNKPTVENSPNNSANDFSPSQDLSHFSNTVENLLNTRTNANANLSNITLLDSNPLPQQTPTATQTASPSFAKKPINRLELLNNDVVKTSQMSEDLSQIDLNDNSDPAQSIAKPPSPKSPKREPLPAELIENRLYEGQRILIQVTKDQLGTKGARLTTNISLPSRYLVYLPSGEQIGISQRIDGSEERTRIKTQLSQLMHRVNLIGGLIARTAAERIPAHKLEEDIYYLLQLWKMVQARRNQSPASRRFELIYQDLALPLRAIRDLSGDTTEKITIDNKTAFDKICQFANEFVPSIRPRISLYDSEQALFDIHRVEEDLKDALNRRVNLKSGGYLIIDQTEAMTTIDVNTGSFVGGRSLEDTVYKTNLEATHAIARQLRLRNLGGIIILDFIDMQEQEHRDDVLASLQEQLSRDYAKTNISQVSDLGLIEMTRKRTRESLQQQLCEPCVACGGKGFVKSPETVCFEIFREIMRFARTYTAPKKFTIVAHSGVIELLTSSEADIVAELAYLLGRVITFEVEPLYNQEQFDIVLD